MINTDFLHSVQNGDEDAIQALIRANQRQVFQLALSILDTSKSDSSEAARQADIATRETFITAVDRIGRYHEDSNFNTWLYAIAIMMARRRLHRWQTMRMFKRLWSKITRTSDTEFNNSSTPNAPTAAAAVPSPAAIPPGTASQASDAVLWDAVRSLDERLRLPVVLRYYHDFSVADIAALLNISEGSVHARLDQARDKLAGK